MLELLLVALVQLNTVFGDASASTSIDSGGNGWGDTHYSIDVPTDTTSLDSGGNGWGDTH